MCYSFDLIWHYLSANSRHGTHSPFLYKLADLVIYDKSNEVKGLTNLSKAEQLSLKISNYLQDNYGFKTMEVDISSMNYSEVINLQLDYSVVIVNGIYKNSINKEKWSKILADQDVSITIDLFYFGVVIWRKEQPKENFKLRFPY